MTDHTPEPLPAHAHQGSAVFWIRAGTRIPAVVISPAVKSHGEWYVTVRLVPTQSPKAVPVAQLERRA